ncbi:MULTISPECIES: hypothetical protein [unclassified Isoptericola]|uniref:hypothetical protein n=1 Tax=unclassified Isoptericola TaxID=2623355 RepID=UPI003667BB4C
MSWYAMVLGALGACALAGAITSVPVLVSRWMRWHVGWLRAAVVLLVVYPALLLGPGDALPVLALPALVGMTLGECLAWAHVARAHPLFTREGYWGRVLTLLGRLGVAGRVAADYRAAARVLGAAPVTSPRG